VSEIPQLDWKDEHRWVFNSKSHESQYEHYFGAEITCFTNVETTMKYRIVRTAERQFKWFAGDILQGFTKTALAADYAASEHSRKWYLWILSKEQNPRSRHYSPTPEGGAK
jgi:hypothetical protein